MNDELIESMKNKSKEERAEFFRGHKSELLDDALCHVNGGVSVDNPNSECPDIKNNYYTSLGFVCRGERWC